MLHNISWSQYFTVIGVMSVFYYSYVLLKYYRKDIMYTIQQRANGKAYGKPGQKKHDATDGRTGASSDDPDAQMFDAVYDLMDSIDRTLLAEEQEQRGIGTLFDRLRAQLNSYPQLKGTGFQTAINNHIVQKSKEVLGLVPTEAEVKNLW